MNKVKRSLVALREGIMRPHARSLLLAAVTVLLTSAQPVAAQAPPPPPGDACWACDDCKWGSGDMCVGAADGGTNSCWQDKLGSECFCHPYGGDCEDNLASAEFQAEEAHQAVKTLTATGTLPGDGPFFFASQSSGDVLLRRKCDGAFVARLARGESRFALLEVAPELAIVAARDRRELAQGSQQPEG